MADLVLLETARLFIHAVCMELAAFLIQNPINPVQFAKITVQERLTMAKSVIYTSLSNSLARGRINFETDVFRMLLVNNNYTNLAENTKRGHRVRSDVTPYETYGFNYTQSGSATVPGPGLCVATIQNIDDPNRDVEISFIITPWTGASFVTSGGIIYKFSGGSSGTDDLVGYVDFGQLWSFSNQTCDPVVDKNLKMQT